MPKNLLKQLRILIAIDELIRDRDFVATQEAIADQLGLSVRSVRGYWDLLESLGAPIHNQGRYCNGWTYSDKSWDLFEALKNSV